MKIIIHTMDHNKHYDYFRRLAHKNLAEDHDVYYFIHKREENNGVSKGIKIKSRLKVEFRLIKLSSMNNDLLCYLYNRLSALLYINYKKEYDREKLTYLDEYFHHLIGSMQAPTDNVIYIDNINNQKEIIKQIGPDLIIIIGAPFIKKHITGLSCKKINLHIGYLPNYKGIKTIEWAVLNKEYDKIGYTIHELTSKLDEGRIFRRDTINVGPENINLKLIYAQLYEKAFDDLIDFIDNHNEPIELEAGGQFKVYYSYKFNPVDYKKLIPRKQKISIYAGNPVQYHVPIYKALFLEDEFDLIVMFGSKIGCKRFYSKEFMSYIQWDIPLLDGYKYKFFTNLSSDNTKGFFSRINPGMVVDIIIHRYDIIIIHGYDTVSSWLVFMAGKLTRSKLIWRGEAAIRPATHQSLIKKIIKKMLLPAYFNMFDAVLYSCSGNKKYLEQFNIGQNRMFLMPCAVDNEFFRNSKLGKTQRQQIRLKFKIREDDFVILFCGRFTERKRPLDLINAVCKINYTNLVLLFVGDGPERVEMEKRAKDLNIRTIFTGFLGQTQLPKYYSIADMYAILSDYDASPKSLNEALNFELPIIATHDVGTSSDLVQEGLNGFVVNSRDIKSIANKIKYLNENRSVARNMGKRSLLISEDWSIKNDIIGLKGAIAFIT